MVIFIEACWADACFACNTCRLFETRGELNYGEENSHYG